MQIVVDGLLTTYQKTGNNGKNILLLHGWGDNMNTFDGLTKELATNNTVVRLDLPGFGQSQPPKDVWSLDDYCEFVVNFVGKLHLKNIDIIIGHSNGGALAIKLVSNDYLNPSKLVLLSSAGIRNKQKAKKLGLKVVAKIGKVATIWLPKSSKKSLQKKLYGTIGSDMLVAPNLKETFKKTVVEDIQSEAKKIKVPTLLIYGAKDKATPVEYGKIYNKLIDGSVLEVVDDAAHFVHHDQLLVTYKLITGFIK